VLDLGAELDASENLEAENVPGVAARGGGRRLAPLISRSLPEQVADRFVQAIGRDVLKADERLIETELARELDVSRAPVREALRTLAIQGVVRQEPNRGVRVVRFDHARVVEVTNARVALECEAARLAARCMREDPHLAAPMQTAIGTMGACADAGDIPGINRADVRFHDALYAASGSETLIKLWHAISRQVEIIFSREIYRVSDLHLLTHEHNVLVKALLEGSDEALGKEVKRHISGLRTLGAGAETEDPA
jgi:DNA-binding GntR family transcriptional regulator